MGILFYHTKPVRIHGVGPMGIWLTEEGTSNRYLVPMQKMGTKHCIFDKPTWGENPCPVCGLEYGETSYAEDND